MATETALLPVIDVGPFFTADPEARRSVAARVGAALEQFGCLQITGHGVPPDLFAEPGRLWREFFAAADARKRSCAPADPMAFRGYYAMSSLANTHDADAAPPDLREVYFVSRVDPLPADYLERLGPAAEFLARPNIWPEGEPELRAASERLYRAMEELAARLLRIFAVALDLPETFFADKIDRHHSTLTVASYPEQRDPPLPGQLRCGAHTDFGSVAILHQEAAVGGLQIEHDGAWRDVEVVPGALVVNLGDLMRAWTDGRWRSPLHRVANPPADAPGPTHRQSLLFFHAPNYDAPVELPTSRSRVDGRASERPLTVGEFMLRKSTRGLVD